MKHYGDVTQINGATVEPVDIITFGSPCQDMSIAGKRAGIQDGKRSNLFFEAVRIIKEMRKETNGEYPKYAVWENVPGAFSSNKGRDFHAVLEALCSVCDDAISIPEPVGKGDKLEWRAAGEIVGNGYSVAWRTLDAQYWGVPQRRKRIYLVADFTGQRAGEILFKHDSLRGDMPQGNEAGKGAAADAMGGTDRSAGDKCLNPWDCQSKRIYSPDGVYPTLPAMDCGGANNQAVIYAIDGYNQSTNDTFGAIRSAACDKDHVGCVVYALQGNGIDRSDNAGCNGCRWRDGEMYTLNTIDRPAVCYTQKRFGEYENGIGTLTAKNCGSHSGETLICCANQKTYQEKSGPLMANTHPGSYTGQDAFNDMLIAGETLCFDGTQITSPQNGNNPQWNDPCHPLASTAYAPTVIIRKPPRKYIIRRLTPTECARLQGFPSTWGELAPYNPADADFWESVRKTHARINGKAYKPTKNLKAWYDKLHTDSAEYKMWGNGIALPCAEYVLHGIAEQGAKTLGSLFDGSGGFPLAGAINGITPLWASEVEPYPIAVTKSRFGGDAAERESKS